MTCKEKQKLVRSRSELAPGIGFAALLSLVLLAVPAMGGEKKMVLDPTATPAQARRGVVVVDPGVERNWVGEPISLSLKDADLQEVLRTLARLADINLILDPQVRGQVTLELKDVPWDQVLYVLLKTHRLGAELDGRIWRIQPAATLLEATP